MKKVYSLKGRKLFKEVYKRGKRFQEKGLFIIVYENKRDIVDKKIKIGISIGKKTGKAYIRNYLKRQIKSICIKIMPEIKNNYYIIIKAETNFKNYGYQEKEEIIKFLFNNAGVLP